MMFIPRPNHSRGLSILESLAVLFTSLMLLIVIVPVALVQLGYYKLPEPEITPKGMVIDGREVVGKNGSAPSTPPPLNKPTPPISTPPAAAVMPSETIKPAPAPSPAPSPAAADKPAPDKPAVPAAVPAPKP